MTQPASPFAFVDGALDRADHLRDDPAALDALRHDAGAIVLDADGRALADAGGGLPIWSADTVAIDPAHADSHYLQGLFRMFAGDTAGSLDCVRRALAIQLIINREWGLAKNQNPNQGSFIIDELTDLVEAAVLAEFDRLTERGGVLGAMETGYQRGRIQDESMLYEHRKHDGSLPIIGVNTFRNPKGDEVLESLELARSTEEEKQSQLARLADFHARHAAEAPAMLARLQQAVIDNGNVFAVLMDAVRVCSLGQITNALFEVGGQYRRNM